MNNVLSPILEIARHEFNCILRTRRAMVIAGLYLVFAVLGGFIYVKIAQSLEEQALAFLVQQGMDLTAAADKLQVMSTPAMEGAIRKFIDLEPDQIATSLRGSIILTVFFASSLAFLPLLIVITSFDQLSSDLESRSLCYSVLKAPRLSILLGKNLAYSALFVVLMGVSSLAFVAMAGAMLEHISFFDSLLGLFRAWLLLIPFGVLYVALASLASVVARTPFAALMLAFIAAVGMGLFDLASYAPEEGTLSVLRYFRYLSPGNYEQGLWMTGIAAPLVSALMLSVFAAVFIGLAAWRLEARDL